MKYRIVPNDSNLLKHTENLSFQVRTKMEIDKKIVVQAGEQLLGHLLIQRDRIEKAYQSNSEILEIGLKCRFSYVKNKFKIQ